MSAEQRPRFTVSFTSASWTLGAPDIDESYDTDDLAEAMESVFDLIQQGRKVKLVARKKR